MNDSELDQLLQQCDPAVPSPAGFTRDVWLRIEAAEPSGWQARVDFLLERLLGFFALPPVAVATCTAMVVAGAWLGMQSATPVPSGELSYIQSVSPFAHSHR